MLRRRKLFEIAAEFPASGARVMGQILPNNPKLIQFLTTVFLEGFDIRVREFSADFLLPVFWSRRNCAVNASNTAK